MRADQASPTLGRRGAPPLSIPSRDRKLPTVTVLPKPRSAILGRIVTPTTWPSRRVWALTAGLLTIGTAVSTILAAVTLEMLMHRPSGGGSMTTMLPGSTYATATVMKVCLGTGFITVAAWILGGMWRRSAAPAPARGLAVWGLASIALVVATPWIGAVGAVGAQAFADTGSGLALGDLPGISRTAVFVQLAVLFAGAVSAAASLAKHERPRLVALLGLAISAVLIGMFWHLRFYAHGFDQDTWAPR